MSPTLFVDEDAESVARRAAGLVLRASAHAADEHGEFRLVLAGGSTPRRLLERLADEPVEWSRVQVFFGDERCVEPDDPASNYRMAREALLDRVPLAEGQVHRICGEEGPERAAALYEEEIAAWPRFDMVLLGLGGDGHTASLFPGGPELSEARRRVVASRSPAPPPERVTLTLPAINASREAMFVVTGEAKAARVAEVLAGSDLPAGRVRPTEAGMILAGDIGGTKTNVGIFSIGDGVPEPVRKATYVSADHPGLSPIIEDFLGRGDEEVSAACFGIAGPVIENRTRTPNLAWEVDGDEVARERGLPALLLINDLQATAEGIPSLGDEEIHILNQGEPDPAGSVALLAPGTGLGMSIVTRAGGGWHPIPTEGGHQSFAPRTEDEIGLLRFLQKIFGHVSVERIVSGPGLKHIYDYVVSSGGEPDPEVAERIDKWRARRGRRRVPEAKLLLLGFLTGFVGAWCAMSLF
ncbi:MAG: 6-phosphogluconolactonase, partial [Planctomycetota bacterium]